MSTTPIFRSIRRFEPIAIVGQGCVLPGALSPADLWSLVREKRSALSSASPQQWRIHPAADQVRLNREIASTVGGHVHGFEQRFDPKGFCVEPDQLSGLDPVFLWTLHAAREALRSSGLSTTSRKLRSHSEFASDRCGLVVGNLSYPTPKLAEFALAQWSGKTNSVDPRNRFMSGLPAHLVAAALGFGGRAFALDAACASSLYAIKLACQQLQDGVADLVMAGGVNHADDLFLHAGFSALRALSPTGQSRPFHRDADGLVPAQGAAMLLLERLDDAIDNGRNILGVIRGIGLSNDGRSRGLMVPAEEGQIRALRAAYSESGLSPHDISLVECHATGTVVGDGAEIRSMRNVFQGVRDLPIGSLKSNMGHLITASGAAAIIKVLAAMRYKVRPPTRHADAPLDELTGDRNDGMFRLLADEEPWDLPSHSTIRRAAISNFGFGGNNAHLILEEWPQREAQATSKPRRIQEHAKNRPVSAAEVAVIAQVVRTGSADFAKTLFVIPAPTPAVNTHKLDTIHLDAAKLRFPPADLRAALPQQTVLLSMAQEIEAKLENLPADRTRIGVLIGMACDPEGARHAIAWRGEPTWVASLSESARTPLSAAAVVGNMPNIVANRLSHQLDIRGPSYTLSSEELSGVVALEIGVRALETGELDVALVGAVDFSCEPVHELAAMSVLAGDRQLLGDAAVLMVLKRHEDALRDGDEVLAILGEAAGPSELRKSGHYTFTRDELRPFGHAHAASGLLKVAGAIEYCAKRALPSHLGPMPWLPTAGRRVAEVYVEAMAGQSRSLRVSGDGAARAPRLSRVTPHSMPPSMPMMGIFAAPDLPTLLATLHGHDQAEPSDISRHTNDMRLAIVGENMLSYQERVARAIVLLSVEDSLPSRLGTLEDGIHLGVGPLAGELAFVFTGAAGAYPHMGRDLALEFPELVDGFAARAGSLRDAAGWVYSDDSTLQTTPIEKLWGASYLSQLHAELSRNLLGLKPTASIGYCSGETNALFALGAWEDLDGFRDDVSNSQVYETWLCGELVCLRTAWNLNETMPAQWSTWRVRAPSAEVLAAAANVPRAHVVIINAPNDVMMAGDPAACAQVAALFGRKAVRTPGYDFVMHCPEAKEFESRWRSLHTRPTRDVPGIRFYTHATCQSYAATSQTAADALTGQAMNLVNFPRLVEQAYADGVRVFLEHGPHAGCTKWISDILGTRPHTAIALDRYGQSSLLQAVEAAARLYAVGVPVELDVLLNKLQAKAGPAKSPTLPLTLPAHPEAIPPMRSIPNTPVFDNDAEWMAPAPRLLPIGHRVPRVVDSVQPTPETGYVQALRDHHKQLSELHLAFIRQQLEVQTRFNDILLTPLSRWVEASVSGVPEASVDVSAIAIPARPHESEVTQPAVPILATKPPIYTKANSRSSPANQNVSPRTPTGPSFDRAALEVHASGEISKIFGPLFEQQDGFARQVRMPQPPLLLATRVLGIEGTPATGTTLGLGTIWTETDVTADAWYLHEGHVPAGILVESGQADLMLISWLGADFLNRGERVYRLLGCELKSHGPLPTIGDTLHYEISVDGHAEQDGIRLFFFHYKCWVNGTLRMSVRNGQAGIFTNEELAGSAGVLWSPELAVPKADVRLDVPVAICTRTSFGTNEIASFINGRLSDCFGPAFDRADCHTRTPTIAGGKMRLLDEVTYFDRAGGPWKRGYLRATLALSPESWFFDGHFKNDPCMPGTLMLEGGLQAMQIYMTALGYTLDHDGSRFEPVSEENYSLRCRGQATLSSKEVVYEIFVEEVIDGLVPTLYADILGSVDGRKAFHCKRMGLRLVPAWPLDVGRLQVEIPADDKPIAVVDGFRFDYASLLACAWGKPSTAFGPMYARFDGTRRVARLPGPPYHFMSRVAHVDGPIGGMAVGSVADIEYDVPPGEWYFAHNNAPAMPFPVLLEAALQPCGWLASYVGGALGSEDNLYFRNLDGTGTQHHEIGPDTGTLRVRTKLTSVSTADAIVIMGFDVTMFAGELVLYSLKTVFGFFPGDTMKDQAGLPMTPAHRVRLVEPSEVHVDLSSKPAQYFGGTLRLPTERLVMIDRITGIWLSGEASGKAQLGRIRAEKDVAASQWFFKAHFYQDPVQPGSLGIEALLQALQALVIHLKPDVTVAAITRPRFETQASGVPMRWKYRGQVIPDNQVVVADVEITQVEHSQGSILFVAEGSLWVDGKRIYEAKGLGVRVREDGRSTPT